MPKKSVRKTAKAAIKKTVRKKAATGRSETGEKDRSNKAASEESRYAELKRILHKKKEELLEKSRAEVSKTLSDEKRQSVESASDDGDWSVLDLEEDINLRHLSMQSETLSRINEALRKLDEKTYGVCDECEEPINPERLRIMPFAIFCRDCQEEKEKLEATSAEDVIFK
jgi:DnaK suppressor protein